MKLKITSSIIGLTLLISLCHAQNMPLSRDQMAANAVYNVIQHTPVTNENPVNTSPNRLSSACDTIITLYATNNGLTGVMFDVVAHMDMTVVGLSGNMTGSGDVLIYFRHGSHLGNENDSTVWTLAGSAPVTPNPVDTPTPIPITLNLDIMSGDTMGFYVAGSGPFMEYTDAVTGNEGDVFCDNGDAAILQGSGVSYPFGFTIGPRVWNGTVDYCDMTTGINSAERIDVSVYPNPFHDAAQFIFNNSASRALELFNCNGELIRREFMSGTTYSLQRKDLSAGLYFFRVTSDNGTHSGKLIIQ